MFFFFVFFLLLFFAFTFSFISVLGPYAAIFFNAPAGGVKEQKQHEETSRHPKTIKIYSTLLKA